MNALKILTKVFVLKYIDLKPRVGSIHLFKGGKNMSFEGTNLFSGGLGEANPTNQPILDFKNPMEEYFTSQYDNRFKLVNSEGKEWNPMLYRPFNMIKWLGYSLYGFCNGDRVITGLSRFTKLLRRGVKVYNRAFKYKMTAEEKEVYCLEDWTRIINRLLEIEMIVDLTCGGIIIHRVNDGTVNLKEITLEQLDRNFELKSTVNLSRDYARFLTARPSVQKALACYIDKEIDGGDTEPIEIRKALKYASRLKRMHTFYVEGSDLEQDGSKVYDVLGYGKVTANQMKDMKYATDKVVEQLHGLIKDSIPSKFRGIVLSRFRDCIDLFDIEVFKPQVFFSSLSEFDKESFSNLVSEVRKVHGDVHTKLANATYQYLISYSKYLIREHQNTRKYTLMHTFLCAVSKIYRTGLVESPGRVDIRDFSEYLERQVSHSEFSLRDTKINDSNMVEFVKYYVRLFNSHREYKLNTLSEQFGYPHGISVLRGLSDYYEGVEFIDRYYDSIDTNDTNAKPAEPVETVATNIPYETVKPAEPVKVSTPSESDSAYSKLSKSVEMLKQSETKQDEKSAIDVDSLSFKDAIKAKSQENILEPNDVDREIMELVSKMPYESFVEAVQVLDSQVVAKELYRFVKLLSERI